jgi:hypothetical protein
VKQYFLGMVVFSLVAGAVASTGCMVEDISSQDIAASESSVVVEPNKIVVPLIAGRHTVIGDIEVWLDGDLLHIRYSTGGDWRLKQTHVAIGETVDDLPTNRPGCPKIGHFPWSDTLHPPVAQHEVVVDLVAEGLDDAAELVIAAHADVCSSTYGNESAWGDGPSFPGCASIAKYFTVNLDILRGLILWNKLGSIEEVTHSEVGPDGIIVGDISFFPVQHGDGFSPDPRAGDHNIPDNYIEFQGLQLGPQGSIEFWYRPTWSDFSIGHVVDILYYGVAEDIFNTHITMHFNNLQNRFNNAAISQGSVANVAVQQFAPIPGWSTTMPIHIAFTWNGCAPVVTDRLMVFVNGVALPNTFFFGDPMLDDWLPGAVLRLGSRLLSGDWNRHNWEGLDGEMDNLKVWNYPKTDFSDRFIE